MANHLDTQISELVSRAAREIAAAVQKEIETQIKAARAGNAVEAPKRRGRPPGSKNKAAAAAPAPAPAPKAAKAGKTAKAKAPAAKSGRRTSAEVAADDARLVDYIKANPGQRSEEIQKHAGLPKQDVASGLQRLRDAGTVKMKGVKRGATYSV